MVCCVQVSLTDSPQSSNGIMQVINRFFTRSSSDPFYAVIAYRNFKRTD